MKKSAIDPEKKTPTNKAPAAAASATTPYIPLARKYRPKTFEELIGQPHITATLSRSIEAKRIGQAYLFTGQRGVGKTSAARILAMSLNCANGPTTRPCQRCASCQEILSGASLDVLEIDGASNRGIDEIRSLRETVKFAAIHGAYRIYIIDEVHMLTSEAFNALLKTLEEPPAHVTFILATTAPQRIPPTILSRCQRFDFRRLEAKTIVGVLRQIAQAERIILDEAAGYAIARAAEGSARDAIVMLDQAASFCTGRIQESDISQLIGAVEHEVLMAWTKAILGKDARTALVLLHQQVQHGREITQIFVNLLLHLRHVLLLRATSRAPSREALLEQLVDLPAEQREQLEAQAHGASTEELLLVMQVLTGAYELARRSPVAQTVLELALIKLATRESWTSIEQLIERLDRLSASSIASRSLPHVTESPAASALLSPAPTNPPPLWQTTVTSSHEGASPSSAASAQEQPDSSSIPSSPAASMTISPEEGIMALEAIAAQWPVVLERIGRQKMSLAAYLMHARPVGVSGRQIQVGIPGFALHQEVLSVVEHVRLIERTLAEMFGQPLTVQYVTLPPEFAAPPTRDSAVSTDSAATAPAAGLVVPSGPTIPPIVQEIMTLFDATVLPRPPMP